MNIGVYLPSLSNHEELRDVCDGINFGIDSGALSDASIFYDTVAYNPFLVKCGMFNSTDLWNFNGTLITTSLSSALMAMKIVNNIDIFYFYGWEKKVNPLHLIYLLNSGIKTLSKTSEDNNDLYRKTGKKSEIVCESFKDAINSLR